MPEWSNIAFWVPFRSWHRSDADIEQQRRSVHRRIDGTEESINAATHALGLAGSLAAAVLVILASATHGGAWQITACAIYAGTLIAAYAASTLSHTMRRPRTRHTFRIIDQAVIFLFIAGSYTPIALTWLRAGPWWVLHILMWSVALIGFTAKAGFVHNVRSGTVTTKLYLALGLLPAIAFLTLPLPMMFWLFAGGLCYVLGIVFFHYDHRIRYFHAIWHMFVLAGSACHYVGVLLYCTGR